MCFYKLKFTLIYVFYFVLEIGLHNYPFRCNNLKNWMDDLGGKRLIKILSPIWKGLLSHDKYF